MIRLSDFSCPSSHALLPKGRAARIFSRSAMFAALLATGLLAGCGGDDESGSDAETPAKTGKSELPDESTLVAGGSGGGGARAPRNGGQAGMRRPQSQKRPQVPVKPPRSSDFADWTNNDFREAVRERDQAVLGAIQWLGQNRQNDDSAELLVELLALSMQPALEPPALPQQQPSGNQGFQPGGSGLPGDGLLRSGGSGGGSGLPGDGALRSGGSGGGQAPPKKKEGDEEGGAGGASISAVDVQRMLLAAVSRNSTQLVFSSVILQNGRPGGYPGGDGQQGPPPGYGEPGAGGYGENMNQDGPPAGYQESGASGYGGEMNQDGPPPGYNDPGASFGGGAPPAANQGQPQSGLGLQPGRSNAYAHYGTLNLDEFVTTTVGVLLQIDTPKAWDAVEQLLLGNLQTPMDSNAVSKLVLVNLLEGYGGPGHPSHTLLLTQLESNTPASELAVELYTDYAASAMDSLLGLTGPAAAQAAGNRGGGGQRRPGAGPGDGGLSAGGGAFGGGPGDGGLSAGGGGPGDGGLSAGGGGPGDGGLSAGGGVFGGGGQTPPAAPSITMNVSEKQLDADKLKRVTSFLWNQEVTQAIGTRIAQQGSLTDNPQLLALAASIPTMATRQAQYQLLSVHQSAGPESLRNAGFFSSVARDPGMLQILKNLPVRKRAPGSPQSLWDEALKDTVLANRDRFRAAARSRGTQVIPMNPPPVRLHKDATPQIVFHTKWPRDVVDAVGDAVPGSTEILYIRMETEATEKNLKSLAKHYEQRIGANKKIESKDAARRLVWYTSLRGLKTGMSRSIDVIFSEAGGSAAGGGGSPDFGLGAGGGGGGGGAKATIEIIVVDTPNPKVEVTSARLDDK